MQRNQWYAGKDRYLLLTGTPVMGQLYFPLSLSGSKSEIWATVSIMVASPDYHFGGAVDKETIEKRFPLSELAEAKEWVERKVVLHTRQLKKKGRFYYFRGRIVHHTVLSAKWLQERTEADYERVNKLKVIRR